ncbi:hypothetical protein Anapl_08775 [Anas platyrhynchos]|uniref:Uncharacterized protein n=1 Tax=Anas platyrhynchos TaxID=8839 RepID=R0LJ13_ANAPL|nr:hypothetical protein Anapl_08775 [Anas platyrhynchos]
MFIKPNEGYLPKGESTEKLHLPKVPPTSTFWLCCYCRKQQQTTEANYSHVVHGSVLKIVRMLLKLPTQFQQAAAGPGGVFLAVNLPTHCRNAEMLGSRTKAYRYASLLFLGSAKFVHIEEGHYSQIREKEEKQEKIENFSENLSLDEQGTRFYLQKDPWLQRPSPAGTPSHLPEAADTVQKRRSSTVCYIVQMSQRGLRDSGD